MSQLVVAADETRARIVSRLLVTVRDSATGSYRPVGFLSHHEESYSFAYLRREVGRPDFRPLPGLGRAATGPARSSSLFPLFAERVISSRRPDRHTSLDALGLPNDAAPFEVLVRSHGQRVGDTVELLPAPEGSAGDPVSFTFLAHGVRHLPQTHQERITRLAPGEPLFLREEPTNSFDPRAHVVTDTDEITLGWLPAPLIDVARSLTHQELHVERASGPEVGFHFRLLVRMEGEVVTGRRLFAGPQWDVVDGTRESAND